MFYALKGQERVDRGIAWCEECGTTKQFNPALVKRDGWPKCCGFIMTVDSPEERKAFGAVDVGEVCN